MAEEFGIRVWNGYELLKALLDARAIGTPIIKEIFDALEADGDLVVRCPKATLRAAL